MDGLVGDMLERNWWLPPTLLREQMLASVVGIRLGREEVASCMNVRKDPLDPPTRGEVAGVNVLPVSNKVKVSVRYDHLLHAMETSGFEFGVNCFWIMDSTDVVSDVIVHGGDPHEHWLEPKLAH